MHLLLIGIPTQIHFCYMKLPREPQISIMWLVFDTAALAGGDSYQNL